MPSVVEYNGKKYIVLGNINMKNGRFLIAINNNDIISVDCSTIDSYLKASGFEIKKPTSGEVFFMTFLKNKIQEKFNNGEIVNYSEINKACNDINKYINENPRLLDNLNQLNDQVINTNMQSLLNYLNSEMSGNQYFKENIKEDDLDSLPEYDEQAVTIILSTPRSTNFDVDKFIKKYLNNFTLEQINLLLTSFNIKESQVKILEERKNNLKTNLGTSSSKANLGKRKTFALPGIKENKEAAFIDTLLLSFTVGIFCGIYLMYFVLTIMS